MDGKMYENDKAKNPIAIGQSQQILIIRIKV